jgi:hypothetical protein
MDSREFKELVYNLMNGFFNLEEDPVEESKIVRDEFQDGRLKELSEEIFAAKLRIYRKMKVEEDEDLELILENAEEIMKELCFRMYDYGAYFSGKNQ